MDPTTMTQTSTQMFQDSDDRNMSERNESLFIYYGSCKEETFAVTIKSIILAFSVCGLVTNGLVLWLLGFCIKRNPFSVYILNLAAADFFYLCCQTVKCIEIFGPIFWDITPSFITTFTFFFYTLGLSLLAAISTERSLAVLFPIWYRCHRPKHTSTVVCSLFWVFYLLGNLLESYACGLLVYLSYPVMSCPAWDFSFITLILILVSLLCTSSLTLILKVQCHSKRRQPSRLYLLILLTILMFLLCGLPMGFHWFLLYWFMDLECIVFVFQLLSCVNSSSNPLIYFFLGSLRQKKRRESLRVLLQRALSDEAETEGTKEISHTEIMEMSPEGAVDGGRKEGK
ncbi:mas-related G-protein coupled receptor member A1-like [Gracilinanus agilis]|uniref:mas-related G-protein coupled receptor member A1-like n=1 Tax=Gracilinanus agilis TaxID=191870 RepID=UPI001CFD2989|nr:mas-related G-protein coupled receptor member A1-like [Gracilinanus agilis]